MSFKLGFMMGFKTNIINHWYMLNKVKQNFHLAVTSNNSKIRPINNVNFFIVPSFLFDNDYHLQ